MTKINETTTKRLLYVKKLYEHGHEHIPYGSELDRMIAIHHFDNAIELLLKCVASHYDLPFKTPLKINFPELWKAVDKEYEQKNGVPLPNKTEMFQLHAFRCDIQHWGTAKFSLDIINRFYVYAHDFINTILSSVFNLKYDQLSMGSLISDSEIRKLIVSAEKYFSDEKWKEAVHKISVAFYKAKRKALKKYDPLGTSYFWSLTNLKMSRFTDFSDLIRTVEKIIESIKVLALNLDFEKYRQFQDNTPFVSIWFPNNEVKNSTLKKSYLAEIIQTRWETKCQTEDMLKHQIL